MKASTIIALSGFCLYTPLHAWAEPQTLQWLDRNSEGWFWYQSDDKDAEKETEKPILSSKWIRENIQHYLDMAIDNPTHENVSTYLMLQKTAMDKSLVFMDSVQAVTIGNADYDEIHRRPTATYANSELDHLATEYTKHTLKAVSQQLGIFLFLDNTAISHKQKEIVDMLIMTYGFDSIMISKEPNRSVDNNSTSIRSDTGQIKAMGILTFPSIALVKEKDEYDIISRGAVSYQDLKQRILVGAKRLNVITQDTFNRTRPVNNIAPHLNITKELN